MAISDTIGRVTFYVNRKPLYEISPLTSNSTAVLIIRGHEL